MSAPVLLDEVNLGSARGGRKLAAPLEVEVVREITPEDLPGIANPPPCGALAPSVKNLRASHHRLAELLARGTPGVEVSAITGYSQSYISSIQRAPAFADLVNYYSTQNQQIYVDALERLKTLGLTSVEELQARIDESPEKFSPRELMELVQLTLIKPLEAKRPMGAQIALPGGASAPLVEIKFVGTTPSLAVEGETIDVSPRRG
jgi:hypothetical protein